MLAILMSQAPRVSLSLWERAGVRGAALTFSLLADLANK
jgi:hypothetical protein